MQIPLIKQLHEDGIYPEKRSKRRRNRRLVDGIGGRDGHYLYDQVLLASVAGRVDDGAGRVANISSRRIRHH